MTSRPFYYAKSCSYSSPSKIAPCNHLSTLSNLSSFQFLFKHNNPRNVSNFQNLITAQPTPKSKEAQMCILTETKYEQCSCICPSVQYCPRCPSSGYKDCVDYKVKSELKEGACVGVGMGECGFITASSKQSVVVEDRKKRKRDRSGDGERGGEEEGGKSICEKLGVLFGAT